MAWPAPQHSKRRVKAAGDRMSEFQIEHARRDFDFEHFVSEFPYEDDMIIRNWRAAHGTVLNTAQAWLRRLNKGQRDAVFGQRLKRHDTIIDKLATRRARDLSTMHDIAGVRAIFRTIPELNDFRQQIKASKAKHRFIHSPEKYDYISSPKETGYRGIHEVVERQVASESGKAWNGLKFEVQLRTAVQHAWATAVEIYDDTQKSRFKFEPATDPAYEQFLLASEMFARVHEGIKGCLPDVPDIILAERFLELESETNAVSMIHGLQIAVNTRPLEKNSILQRTKSGELIIHTFKTFIEALRTINFIENQDNTVNAVLVGAKTPSHIREAFRNYFEDTSLFVDLLESSIDAIMENNSIHPWRMQLPM